MKPWTLASNTSSSVQAFDARWSWGCRNGEQGNEKSEETRPRREEKCLFVCSWKTWKKHLLLPSSSGLYVCSTSNQATKDWSICVCCTSERASRRGTWSSSTWCQVLWTEKDEHLILLVNQLSLQLDHSPNYSTDRRLLVIDQSKANCIAGIIQVKGKAKLNIPVSRCHGSISDCNHTIVELTWPPSNKRSWIQYQNQLRAHPSRSKHIVWVLHGSIKGSKIKSPGAPRVAVALSLR